MPITGCPASKKPSPPDALDDLCPLRVLLMDLLLLHHLLLPLPAPLARGLCPAPRPLRSPPAPSPPWWKSYLAGAPGQLLPLAALLTG